MESTGLDDYNPFGEVDRPMPRPSQPSQLPAVLPLGDSYTPNVGQLEPTSSNLTIAELQRRQLELDARTAQLDMREQQLAGGIGSIRTDLPNWPPFPVGLPCKPFTRIDFEQDIPIAVRDLARRTHYIWLGYSLLLAFNIIGALAYFIVTESAGAFFGVSLLVAAITPIGSFYSWNRTLYRALKKDSSINFCVYFPMFGIQIIVMFIQTMGIDYLGACGWINSLKLVKSNLGVSILMLMIAGGFTVILTLSIILFIRVHSHYRGSNASFARAKQEFAKEAVGAGFPNSS